MIFIILTLVAVLLFAPVSSAISISHGSVAPDFTLRSIDGKTISLKEFKDKVVVLIFWRTKQKRSIQALQDAKDIYENNRKKGVQVLSIIEDSDDRENALSLYTENEIGYPLLIDTDRNTYGSYGIRVYPSTVIVDRQGIIAYDIPSHPLTYKTKLRGYIKKALGEIDEKELKNVLSPHNEVKDKASLEASRLYNLALKFTESRLLDMAINTAEKAATAEPELADAHILLGFLYLETHETDKAFSAFNKAVELDPKSNDAQTGLGGVLILKGDIDRAIEILDNAAVANPYPQMTYYELGKAYEKKGDKDKSSDMYKKAIEKIVEKQILPSFVSKCK